MIFNSISNFSTSYITFQPFQTHSRIPNFILLNSIIILSYQTPISTSSSASQMQSAIVGIMTIRLHNARSKNWASPSSLKFYGEDLEWPSCRVDCLPHHTTHKNFIPSSPVLVRRKNYKLHFSCPNNLTSRLEMMKGKWCYLKSSTTIETPFRIVARPRGCQHGSNPTFRNSSSSKRVFGNGALIRDLAFPFHHTTFESPLQKLCKLQHLCFSFFRRHFPFVSVKFSFMLESKVLRFMGFEIFFFAFITTCPSHDQKFSAKSNVLLLNYTCAELRWIPTLINVSSRHKDWQKDQNCSIMS